MDVSALAIESARAIESFLVVSARRRALIRASALSESSTTLARSRSYVHSALPNAHITLRPSALHAGNSPPISLSFLTGTDAMAGAATDTDGAALPIVGIVTT